jgi:hypothetical protein
MKKKEQIGEEEYNKYLLIINNNIEIGRKRQKRRQKHITINKQNI